jgi:mannosyltransferase
VSTTSPGRPVRTPQPGPGGTTQPSGQAGPGAAGAPTRPAAGWRSRAARYAPAAAAVMTGFGLWGLGRDNAMGNDEVVSRWAALLPLRQLAHLVRHVDAVHGLYYLLLHFWMVVGTSATTMRVPSVVSMAVGAALIVVIGRRLTGSAWAGLLAGIIMAITPTISYYAQTARSYAFVFTCVLAETLVLLHALRAEKDGAPRKHITRWWLGYGLLVLLAAYLNEMSLLVLLAHGVTVLLARYGRQAVKHWAVTAAAAAVLVSPLMYVSAREAGALNWVPRPGPRAVWVLYHDYFGATFWAPLLVALCAAVALLPAMKWEAGGTWRGSGAGPQDSPPSANEGGRAGGWVSGGISLASVAAPLLVLPAAVLMIESLAAKPLYVDRYVLFGEAGAALLAGAGLYRIGGWLVQATRHPQARWLPGIAVCVVALVLQIAPQQRVRGPGSRMFNFGGPAFYVAAHAQPGDGVLFFGTFFRKVELGYPAQFRDTRDFGLAVPPQVTAPYRGIEKPFTAVRPLMLQHSRIWVIGHRPSADLPAGSLREESDVLLRYFTRTAVAGYRGMWVTLWQRRS